MRYSYILGCVVTLVVLLYSCNLQEEKSPPKSLGPKVVEAKGYVVPADSMAQPKVYVIDESKLRKVPAGKPKIAYTNTNIHTAGKPKIVIAGTPRVCTPGQDTFLLPKVVPAINKTVLAGLPEVVVAKDPAVKDQNPQNFSSFDRLQGLNNSSIRCMLQDQFGNIWLGTQGGGVSRYDGKNFSHFTTNEGLVNNRVFNILEDKAGNLWFSTSAGICRYDGKTFTHFTTAEGLPSNEVSGILEDKTGNIWISTAGGGLCRYDGYTFTCYTTKEGLPSNEMTAILQDRAGNLWFGTDGAGVCKYDGKSFVHYTTREGLSNNSVTSILEDKSGNIWFGTWEGGISRYDGKTFTHFTTAEGLSSNIVYTMLEDQSGNIWFGTYGSGVNRYDGKTFTHFTKEEGLSDNFVVSILEDRSGNLWFGTDLAGVNRYNGKTFSFFSQTDGLSDVDVHSIIQDQAGNLWFGSFGDGLSRYGNNAIAHFTLDSLISNLVKNFVLDQSGNIWIGTNGSGAIKFDGKSYTYFNTTPALSGNSVRCSLEDQAGNLWFGTYGSGACKYDGKTLTQFTTSEGLSHNTVRSILEDREGNLWFGTHGGGVDKYDGKTFTHFTSTGGLSGNNILAMLEDQSGNLWFCTEGGVSRYDGKSFTQFTTAEGLPDNIVFSIMEDHTGNLWFGTSIGLSVLTQNKLLELNETISSNRFGEFDVFFKNYTYNDGFLGLSCNQNALFEDSTGTIWIGANNKLTAYHPPTGEEIPNTLRPNIQVTAIALYNEPIAWSILDHHKDSTLTLGNGVKVKDFKFNGTSKWYGLPQDLSLAYRNNFVTFYFIGITMNQSSKVQYQYKLDGIDENWSSLSTRNEAPYGNLPQGKYTFKVKAMDSAGNWSDEFHYPYTIRPPWWLTWWAYGIYAFTMITLIMWMNTYLKARTLRIERERTQAKELEQAKEIEKAYTQLETAHESLKSTQKQLIHAEKMASLGELTAGIAHEIQNPLNFVNNFSDVNKELLVEMKEEIDKGNYIEVGALATDILTNEQKINHHGKRADAIVKGMLQHSRTNSGTKEQTDINVLADEYLRLAYHGLRAKDKAFNATMKTDFDDTIGLINVIPQDIGRVILNLITNAFYAVSERAKMISQTPYPLEGGPEFVPTVSVQTKLHLPLPGGRGSDESGGRGSVGTMVTISVSDNGPGIPESALDKIFQPFFTTKPTGQGTGLGLSLSYDIIKAHGGELKVETKEGEGTVFTIQLPLS